MEEKEDPGRRCSDLFLYLHQTLLLAETSSERVASCRPSYSSICSDLQACWPLSRVVKTFLYSDRLLHSLIVADVLSLISKSASSASLLSLCASTLSHQRTTKNRKEKDSRRLLTLYS